MALVAVAPKSPSVLCAPEWGLLPVLIAQNNAIAVTDIWEQNEKTVNHIFLNTIAKGIAVNNTQLDLLRSIAGQCPYEGGTAVFDARALLNGLTNDVFDDEILCAAPGGQGLMLPPTGNTTSLPGVQVYPNPTDKELTVRFANATEEELEVRLINLYGQALSNYHIPEQTVSYSLQLPEMPNGIYWLIIYSGDGQKEVKRVVINR